MPTLACFTVNRDTGVTLAAVSAAFFILYTTTLMLVARSATLHRLLVCAALAGLTHLWCATLDWVVLLPSPRVDMVTLSWVACASAAEAVFVSRIDASQLLLDVKGGGTGSVVPRRRSRARSFPGIGLGAGSAAGGGAPARPTRPGEGGEWWLLGWRALCVFFNLRRVGTRWEPSGVRRSSLGSAAGARDRGRLRFVLAMASRCVLCYLAVDLIGLFPRPEAHLITRDKQTLWRLWDLSAEDVGFRLSATAGIWITSYLFQTFNVSLAGLIAVGAGLSNPETWPPVFGPLWTMYSIRGFWG